MAAFDSSRVFYGSASVAGRALAPFNTLFAAIAAWNDARLTRKALSGLTDRELNDIGLARGDIENVARGK